VISPLARPPEQGLKTRRKRADGVVVPLEGRAVPLIGLCIHTTGGTIVHEAVAAHAEVLDYVVKYYLAPDHFFPNYVVGARGWRGGDLVAICAEERVSLHVGLAADEIRAYGDGTWRQRIDARRWDAVWKDEFPTPMHMYRRSSPNRAFVGLEMPPLEKPRENGLRYTDEQHETVAELASDIFARYGLEPERRRIVGHEDLQPLSRFSGGQGWDPGGLRERPWFDWSSVLRRLGLEPGKVVG